MNLIILSFAWIQINIIRKHSTKTGSSYYTDSTGGAWRVYNFVENAYIIDKQVYSLPSSAYLKGIIYNKEVFNKAGITEAPKSQDAFIRDLEMIKERTDAIPFYTCYDFKWILSLY